MDYQRFKNEISNLKAYYRSMVELEEETERLFYELTGVKGLRYDRQPTSYNQQMSESYRLELIEKLEQIEKEKDFTREVIDRYEKQLNRLPDEIRVMVVLLFIEGKSFREVSEMVGYSDHGLYYRIKKEIEKL